MYHIYKYIQWYSHWTSYSAIPQMYDADILCKTDMRVYSGSLVQHTPGAQI